MKGLAAIGEGPPQQAPLEPTARDLTPELSRDWINAEWCWAAIRHPRLNGEVNGLYFTFWFALTLHFGGPAAKSKMSALAKISTPASVNSKFGRRAFGLDLHLPGETAFWMLFRKHLEGTTREQLRIYPEAHGGESLGLLNLSELLSVTSRRNGTLGSILGTFFRNNW